MKNEIAKNELVKHQPATEAADTIIEGEFTALPEDWRGQASGFLCMKCKWPLLTGESVCPKCSFDFGEPTLSVAVVYGHLTPEARERFWGGRTTPEEQERLQKLREKRR